MITVLISGKRVDVTGDRLQEMIAWLIANAEEVNRLPQAKIEFNCAGRSTKISLTRFDQPPTLSAL